MSATPPDGRLPAQLEAAAIMRRAQSDGGFAAVIRRGDPDRGSLALVVTERGRFHGLLERVMGADWVCLWQLSAAGDADAAAMQDALEKRGKADADLWIIELDIPNAERFIAETTSAG
jgi:hypothetical protein